MIKNFLFVVAVFVVMTVAVPALTDAQSGGLVPCGNETTEETIKQYDSRTGTLIDVRVEKIKNPCDYNALIRGVKKLIDFFFYISVPLTIIALVWAGVLYLTSGGNTGQVEKAKKMFVPILIGFLFLFTAWLIVSLIISSVAKKEIADTVFGTFLKKIDR